MMSMCVRFELMTMRLLCTQDCALSINCEVPEILVAENLRLFTSWNPGSAVPVTNPIVAGRQLVIVGL